MNIQIEDVSADIAALRKKSRELFMIEFSEASPEFELTEPAKTVVPHCWRWEDYYPLLQRSAEIVDPHQAFRRSFMLCNPGLYPKPFTTQTLDSACSLYNPGETAPVHRHTPSASRFGLEGTGGFSTVEGEKCSFERGDLVLTPPGTWHDFGNDGDEQIVFFDVVNDPLCMALGGSFYDLDYTEMDVSSNSNRPVPRQLQTVREPLDHSQRLYAVGGAVPKFVTHRRGNVGDSSPMFVYRYNETREILERLRDYEGSPYDGIILGYVNPVNGEPAMPTMEFSLQLLRPNEHTAAHRHTASTLYCVVEGAGSSQVGETRIEWHRNDIFVVPGWEWHQHINQTDDAVLFSVSDEPVFRKLGLHREQGRDTNGDLIEV